MNIIQLALIGFLLAGCECCSYGFTDINAQCLALHTEVTLPWEDAKLYCENTTASNSYLAKITTGQTLRLVYEYILEYGLKGSFWLGASDLSFEDDWLWIDDERVNMGTPFWALYNGVIGGWNHEPDGGSDENCLALDEQRLYYFNDANCSLLFHPICQEV